MIGKRNTTLKDYNSVGSRYPVNVATLAKFVLKD